jgi:hypothetical protein
VQAGYVPPGLARGSVVDVYGVTDPAGTATGEGVVLVVGAAPVQAVSGRAEGVLSTATTTVQVVVAVPAADAPGVLTAIGGRPLVVVVHGSVDSAAPTSAPRPGAASASPTRATASSSPSSSPSSSLVPSTAPSPPPVAPVPPVALDPAVPPVAVDPAAPPAAVPVDPAAGAPAVPAA